MRLSIITINYNDAVGIKKTLASVASQTYSHIEHIIVDGGSTDGSVEIIREYADNQCKVESVKCKGTENIESECNNNNSTQLYITIHNPTPSKHHVLWISEKDNGIYNAMNKGIRMATGEYCQFLNSGDILAAPDVTERMIAAISNWQHEESVPVHHKLSIIHQEFPTIFYGNMNKLLPNGKILHDACNGGNDVTLDMFYRGCLNHSPAYIKRSLFDKYGMYDENLRICSDWKFYMQSIVLGGEKVQYVDIDMTLFDMTGISETNKDLLNNERNQLLKEMVPVGILRDYDNYHFAVDQYKRLKKHHLWGFVYFIERVLFKLEKWHILR